MEVIGALLDGIYVALEPVNLGLAIIGVVVGLFVGAVSYTHLTLPTICSV